MLFINMKNINTIETTTPSEPRVEQEVAANEAIVLREKLENDGGYTDEADMLAEMWTRLREHGIEDDEHLLFTGHNLVPDSPNREETFGVTAEEYAQALAYHYNETPLEYATNDEEGVPTVSVYDNRQLLSALGTNTTQYKALPGHTVEEALIAQFDVSDWM
jgi:hypothetical protein